MIPNNLTEALAELDNIVDTNIKDVFMTCQEEEVIGFHLSFGMYLRNHWKLWHDSKLAQWFESIGIRHPDDMSHILVVSWYRKLHNLDINLDQQVKRIHDYYQF